jgi:hypothetical protein
VPAVSEGSPIPGAYYVTGNGTTGSRRETMWRDGANSMTFVQQVAAPGPGIEAICTSTMLGPRLK